MFDVPLINVNKTTNSDNILSSLSPPMPTAPNIKIKTYPPSSCADTGSDSILLRQTDAVAATLDIQPTRHPLHVRFPDGQTAKSIGITTVALPSTDIPLPAHIFTDEYATFYALVVRLWFVVGSLVAQLRCTCGSRCG